MVKMILTTVAVLILSGCEQQYRYPCHNPANWENDRCKKPLCEINKDCPEYILKGSYINGNGSSLTNNGPVTTNTPINIQQCQPVQQKGVCK